MSRPPTNFVINLGIGTNVERPRKRSRPKLSKKPKKKRRKKSSGGGSALRITFDRPVMPVSIVDCLKIIQKYYEIDREHYFWYPLFGIKSDNFLDLSTLKLRVVRGYYRTFKDFVKDLKNVFKTAMKVRARKDDIVYIQASKMLKTVKKHTKKFPKTNKVECYLPEETRKKTKTGKRGRPPKVKMSSPSGPVVTFRGRKECENLLRQLIKRDNDKLFVTPVPVTVANYYFQTLYPLDFQTVDYRMKFGVITSMTQFLENMEIVFQNATSFNHPLSKVYRKSKELYRYYVEMISKKKQGNAMSKYVEEITEIRKSREFVENLPSQLNIRTQVGRRRLDPATNVEEDEYDPSFNLLPTMIPPPPSKGEEKKKKKLHSILLEAESLPETKKIKKKKKKKKQKKGDVEEEEEEPKKRGRKKKKKKNEKKSPRMPLPPPPALPSQLKSLPALPSAESLASLTPMIAPSSNNSIQKRKLFVFPYTVTRDRFSAILSSFLKKVKQDDRMMLFHEPVDSERFPDYPLKISNPMDFQTISDNIDEEKYLIYRTDEPGELKKKKRGRKKKKKVVDIETPITPTLNLSASWNAYEDDIFLTFDNAKSYNPNKSSYVYKEAVRMKRLVRLYRASMIRKLSKDPENTDLETIVFPNLKENKLREDLRRIKRAVKHSSSTKKTTTTTTSESSEDDDDDSLSLSISEDIEEEEEEEEVGERIDYFDVKPNFTEMKYFMQFLEQEDRYQFFYFPIDIRAIPDYTMSCPNPMSISEMEEKVKMRTYRNFGEFHGDFDLVLTNAMKYNPSKSPYWLEARRIWEVGTVKFFSMVEKVRRLGVEDEYYVPSKNDFHRPTNSLMYPGNNNNNNNHNNHMYSLNQQQQQGMMKSEVPMSGYSDNFYQQQQSFGMKSEQQQPGMMMMMDQQQMMLQQQQGGGGGYNNNNNMMMMMNRNDDEEEEQDDGMLTIERQIEFDQIYQLQKGKERYTYPPILFKKEKPEEKQTTTEIISPPPNNIITTGIQETTPTQKEKKNISFSNDFWFPQNEISDYQKKGYIQRSFHYYGHKKEEDDEDEESRDLIMKYLGIEENSNGEKKENEFMTFFGHKIFQGDKDKAEQGEKTRNLEEVEQERKKEQQLSQRKDLSENDEDEDEEEEEDTSSSSSSTSTIGRKRRNKKNNKNKMKINEKKRGRKKKVVGGLFTDLLVKSIDGNDDMLGRVSHSDSEEISGGEEEDEKEQEKELDDENLLEDFDGDEEYSPFTTKGEKYFKKYKKGIEKEYRAREYEMQVFNELFEVPLSEDEEEEDNNESERRSRRAVSEKTKQYFRTFIYT